jgi:hypothetical protein
MAQSNDDKVQARVRLICERMLARVEAFLKGPEITLSTEHLKNLMFVTREAWYLSSDRVAELTPEDFKTLEAMAAEEDDEEFLTSEDPEDEEGDDDPFGLGAK